MYIVYELIGYEPTRLQEIDGISRFNQEHHAIDRIDEVRDDRWQEFTILKVYIGEDDQS